MGLSGNAAASRDKSCPAPIKSHPGRVLGKFMALIMGLKSVYGKVFFWRLGVAARSGWACLLLGLVLEYGHPVIDWMAIPFFSVVICLNTIESSIGATFWNVVGVLIGMAQAMSIGVVVLLLLGTKLSLALAMVCIFVASFLVAYPNNTREMTRKVALGHIGIIFITAHTGQNNQSLIFFVRLMVTSMIGISCAIVAVLVPVPGLACWEARTCARSAVRGSLELFQSLVDAFSTRDASSFSSIFLHAKFLYKLACDEINELNSRQVHAIWELRGFGLILTFKRMVKGLNGLRLHLLGMTLALQTGTILLTPGIMSSILKGPLKRMGDKSKAILELTTKLSKSKAVLLEKQECLEEAKAEFGFLEEIIMLAREETYYKDEAEEQSLDELLASPNPHGFTTDENIKHLLRTMVPTYFFLFNLRMFFTETMNIVNSGKMTNRIHQIATSGHRIRTLEQSVSKPYSERSASDKAANEFGACGCEYQLPRTTRWETCLQWLSDHGLKLDRVQFARACKISLAMSMAALGGIKFNKQYGFWANISIGFIVQEHQGGSFRMGSLRIQGTALGAIYGYLAILITHNHPYLVLISLIPWVTVLSYLRFCRVFGPAGVIAGLTAAIIMLGQAQQTNEHTNGPVQELALIRIAENFIGVLSLVIVEMVVWPNRAVTLCRENFVSSLTGLRDCVANVIAAYTGNYCPKHRRMVVQGIKKLEQELRTRFAQQGDLQSEAIMEPDFWNVPFPAEIYSKLNHIQGQMLDLLFFMVCSLHAATEDCLKEQIERLVGPLQTSLVALEDEVLSSLDILQKVLQVKRHKIAKSSEKWNGMDDEENCELGQIGKLVGEVLLLQCRQRAVDGTPLSMQSTMEAFEVRYEEVVSGFIAAKRDNPAGSLLSNSAMLSFSAVTFSLKSLLRETVELEKAVHELLHFENPWSVTEFGQTFPEVLKNGNLRWRTSS
ncbi:unnamed protein product [Calypogeia fissa]